MFTVIIADKNYLEKIDEFQLFLKPLIDSNSLAFCEWNIEGERLADMLPTLPAVVGRRGDWRAIVICDERGLEKSNPFDLVDYVPGRFHQEIVGEIDDGIAEEYEEFRVAEHGKLLQAYEDSIHNPLTRLASFFCEIPTVTRTESEANEDPEYGRYIERHQKKQELLERIRDKEALLTSVPQEIICIAKRTVPGMGEDYATAWASHDEEEYSRFYDRNLYFDKMRYLLFDILPKEQRNYMFDYIRFLYATLLVAANDIPLSTLSSQRIYNLQCETDEAALRKLLSAYEAKLDATKNMLELRIEELQEKKPVKLSDKEAAQIFCAKVSVPVILSTDFDRSELYPSATGVGLAGDCPTAEDNWWYMQYVKSKKALHNFLKQSRRALNRAAKTARESQEIDLDKVGMLNEFQIEDVKEHISSEEMDMLAIDVPNLYDEEGYNKILRERDSDVRHKIDERMTRNATWAVGLCGIFAYILGFFTLFYKNAFSNLFNISASAVITLSALGIIALTVLITLFFLRGALVERIRDYRRAMKTIDSDIEGAMDRYSSYLGHVSNVRRGFAVVQASEKHEDPNAAKIILYRKHLMDIETARAQTKDVFGPFMVDNKKTDLDDAREYDYNFDRPAEYVYPFPYSPGNVRNIEFLHSGVPITIPVDFVKNISVRREELYE